jgi:hypothetical protein
MSLAIIVNIGGSELLIVVVWLALIVAFVWAVLTLKRIRDTQVLLGNRLSSIEELLRRSSN